MSTELIYGFESKKYGKYGAKKVGIYNKKTNEIIKFDSKQELNRFLILKKYEENGKISNLECQKKFKLISLNKVIKTTRLIIKNKVLEETKTNLKKTYKADFYYHDNHIKKWVIEDVKSEATIKNEAYVITRKMVLDYLLQEKNTDTVFREVIENEMIDWSVEFATRDV